MKMGIIVKNKQLQNSTLLQALQPVGNGAELVLYLPLWSSICEDSTAG